MANDNDNNTRRTKNRDKLRAAINRDAGSTDSSVIDTSGELRGDEGSVQSFGNRSGANPFRTSVNTRDVAEQSNDDAERIDSFAREVQQTDSGIGRRQRRKRNPNTGKLEWGDSRDAATNSNTNANRNETEENAIPMEPRPIRQRRRRRVTNEDEEKLAMISLISIGCASLFDIAALFLGKHWSLYDEQTTKLAIAVDGAIDTLPGNYYAIIKKAVENYFPWVTLAIVAGKIIIPRVNETFKPAEQPRSYSDQTDNTETHQPIPDIPNFDTGTNNGTKYRSQSSFR